jgi:cyanophycin synthetase
VRNSRIIDVFHFKHYPGPNPYLDSGAAVFDLWIDPAADLLDIEDLCYEMGRDLPRLRGLEADNYPELFARVVSEVNKLEMGLHFEKFGIRTVKDSEDGSRVDRIAVESLDKLTTYDAIELVRDWWEAIADDRSFDILLEIRRLQTLFRRSTYGGPTVYALLKTARARNIPTFHLRDERLMQYGYGKYSARGVATTFDRDSQLDSDFTTHKDDCKAFLEHCGFPVPRGRIVYTLDEALDAVDIIGYPVAVKPVVGHKGIGVTADVRDDRGLEFAFAKAKEALSEGNSSIIVERSITGADYRLLCVGGDFVAAVERRPPYVVGDGVSAIDELIDRENATTARQDTPTSPLGKIPRDEVTIAYLNEQKLTLDDVLDKDRVVYLRKVANISMGGVSIDATTTIHPDNMILAQDIASYFGLVCLGIDAIARDISRSWKEGDFAVLEINAAPGVSMHLNPAIGDSVDVPSSILDHLFPPACPCRIPIVTFNRLYKDEIFAIVNSVLSRQPNWTIGSISRDGIWINYSPKPDIEDYNQGVKSLLRHPKLDFLIAEYSGDIFEDYGMAYEGSDLVILDEPTEKELLLGRDLLPHGTLIVKEGNDISARVRGSIERYSLAEGQSFSDVFLKEIARALADLDR